MDDEQINIDNYQRKKARQRKWFWSIIMVMSVLGIVLFFFNPWDKYKRIPKDKAQRELYYINAYLNGDNECRDSAVAIVCRRYPLKNADYLLKSCDLTSTSFQPSAKTDIEVLVRAWGADTVSRIFHYAIIANVSRKEADWQRLKRILQYLPDKVIEKFKSQVGKSGLWTYIYTPIDTVRNKLVDGTYPQEEWFFDKFWDRNFFRSILPAMSDSLVEAQGLCQFLPDYRVERMAKERSLYGGYYLLSHAGKDDAAERFVLNRINLLTEGYTIVHFYYEEVLSLKQADSLLNELPLVALVTVPPGQLETMQRDIEYFGYTRYGNYIKRNVLATASNADAAEANRFFYSYYTNADSAEAWVQTILHLSE